MKKVIIIIVIVVLIAILGIGAYYILNKNDKLKSNDINETVNKDSNENVNSFKKILVVYYSAQSHTDAVAKKIASNLNANIFKIEPKEKYTSDDLDWTNNNSRVSKEHDNESLRNVELVTTKVDNWDSYDIVLIGYPIWWGIAAWPVNNFVKDNDFTGKTVIPFCTSASSGLGQSGKLLEKEANSGIWQEGHRFSSSATDADIKSFTDSIK